jgi:hypothetical protein
LRRAHVADIWVGSHGIGWQIFAVPELGLESAEGLDGADLDRPAWSSQGFEATRKAINDKVRAASPTAKIADDPGSLYSAGPLSDRRN